MKLSYKAALFSALVLPGSGYFFVGKSMRAWLAILISLSCLAIFILEASHKAQIIAEKILAGTIPFDVGVIQQQLDLTPGLFDPNILWLATIMIVGVWLFSAINCFFIGRRFEQDK